MRRSLPDRLAPPAFVLIWASGFIVARLVAPHAEPLTFLTARYVGTTALLTLLALIAGASWPATGRAWFDAIVAGILLQAIYLGGVFWAVRHGLPAGIAALITSMQPILTGLLAGPLLGEKVTVRRWVGLVAGVVGVALVLAPKLGVSDGLPLAALFACIVSMLAVTLGTLWQKRTGGGDLRTQAAVQFAAALVVTLPVALLTENLEFDASAEVWVGLAWAVLGLSTGGILLLLGLIRRGAVAGVSALFYLVPPVAAVMAYALFGEQLGLVQIAGMAIAVAGVALARG
ncbi:DMT family transporter [Chelatococcus reniformis]|uniref:Peptide ABC transporter ATP-binding protein n=1 Tax=Chelatococcus reniformis TaxID=1494448 RepID=A0A916TYF8_9HYPH|nr:DMT family transporter [Chelatococcus reniformis]GGC50678.1 peptide ABC transporter ATP-binding protein [Chelatococcus reniformis]